MSDPSAPPSSPPSAPPTMPTPAPRRRGGVAGCLGRLLSALLVILIAASLAFAAAAAGAYALGFTPQSPAELRDAQLRVATLEAQNGAILSQNVAMQTQLAEVARQASGDREILGETERQLADVARELDEIRALRERLDDELTTSARENATLVAEMRDSQEIVATFATAEAGRAALLAEIQRRSERVERFLQRLSDISEDAALDLASGTPTLATPPAAETATPTPADDTPTPTPAPDDETPSRTPEATGTPEATPDEDPTTTPLPGR